MLLKWIWFGMLLWQFKPEPIPKKVFQLVVTWKLGACCSILLAMAWTIFSLIRWHFLPHLLDSLAASSISNGRPGPLNALHAIHAKATLWGFFVEIFQGKHFQMPDWQHSKYAYITIHIYNIYTWFYHSTKNMCYINVYVTTPCGQDLQLAQARLQFWPILRIHGLHFVGAGFSEGFFQTTGIDFRIKLAFAWGRDGPTGRRL